MSNQFPSAFFSNISFQDWDFGDFVLKTRLAQALEKGIAHYPIYRSLRFAARQDLQTLFDRAATELGWRAYRLRSNFMMFDGDGIFVTVRGSHKTEYCSCFFSIWAESIPLTEKAQQMLLNLAGDTRIVEPMFSIDWHFLTAKRELESASIEELANDVLEDEAYPELSGGIYSFIERYLDAPETVLVLQGAPGTGKTRLIRAILGEISRRNGGEAQALYTGDKKTLESDEIFVKFITGRDDAFVVEDADHLLKPRSDGNENLHRFLAIADGVVRAQGRKIIFSTNLPNIKDLDDALIRPGRCFARIHTRPLSQSERDSLLERLCQGNTEHQRAATVRLALPTLSTWSLADIYQACAKAKEA
ncbi:MAG: AAA family ATPase [Betaproteobacteria bacterium]|nr:AAA family ATPase [Betaproteobacteria bacterium]